ncbi:MAG: amidohydrolase family protein [Acidobacteria bacterium]|nr:amidohydrolase family protein [Acidobacteriota bacterium]
MGVDLVIRDAMMVSPRGTTRGDLLVAGGRIAGAVASGAGRGAQAVDASGLYLLPGGVDPHVHMMDPGLTEKEDFASGTSAAAVGGVTTIVEHHRSLPFVLDANTLREKAAYLADRGLIDFALFGGLQPDNIHHLEPMWRAGAAAFKGFTCNLHGAAAVLPDTMLEAFREVAGFDGLCLIHAEDEFITRANEVRLKAAGRKDFRVVPEWRTREAEQLAVATTALLARLTGCRVVIAHASHPAVLDILNRERAAGARLWAESCPQYFYLTEEEIDRWGPWHKFTPPARDRASAEQMWQRLEAGAIDMIVADHAPATRADKSKGLQNIWDCSYGIPGVETVLPMMLTGVNQGKVSLERLVAARSQIPAQVYGLWPRKGSLSLGADADFVLVDMQAEKVLQNQDMVCKVGWTPYQGQRVKGLPVKTFVRGQLVAENGRPAGKPGWGRFLPGPGARQQPMNF